MHDRGWRSIIFQHQFPKPAWRRFFVIRHIENGLAGIVEMSLGHTAGFLACVMISPASARRRPAISQGGLMKGTPESSVLRRIADGGAGHPPVMNRRASLKIWAMRLVGEKLTVTLNDSRTSSKSAKSRREHSETFKVGSGHLDGPLPPAPYYPAAAGVRVRVLSDRVPSTALSFSRFSGVV